MGKFLHCNLAKAISWDCRFAERGRPNRHFYGSAFPRELVTIRSITVAKPTYRSLSDSVVPSVRVADHPENYS